MRHEDVQQELAAALLGGAVPDERITRHVRTCALCAAEQASMQGVTQLLAQLSLDDITTPPPTTTPDLLPRLLERVALERAGQRRRRRLTVVSALALAAAVVAIALASVSGSLTSVQHTITASASARGISATAVITPIDTGSELRLHIRGVPRGTRCVLRVETARGGQTLVVWTADYYGSASTRGHSRYAPADITRVTVSRLGGPLLLMIPVSA
ncbi:MAG: hypothetical protein ACYC3W_01040 [Candidatus Nanopelagicales bacterium]